MGRREEFKIQYGELSRTILKVIAVVGICAAVTIMPGLTQLLPAYRKRKPAIKKHAIRLALKRLEGRGFIRASVSKEGQEYIELTPRGHEELIRYAFKEKALKRPLHWDNQWRVVVFDIREKARKTRDLVRSYLKIAGFARLQDSVWIHPFPCEDIVELIRSGFDVRSEVIYLTCGRFPSDSWLCREFELKTKRAK